MMMDMDALIDTITAAQADHAALIGRGTDREIRVAYIAALEAERAMLLDCGGAFDVAAAQDIAYQIEDERAALARIA